MDYSCVGFDIRIWPCEGVLSSESSCWEQDYVVYNDLKLKFDLKENFYQLLEVKDEGIFCLIKNLISRIESCNLIAICIPKSIALLNNERFGYPAGYSLDLSDFFTMGVDVGDVDGFFSVLQHPRIEKHRGSKNILSQDDFSGILDVVQLAGFIDENHAPYCAIKIMSLKI